MNSVILKTFCIDKDIEYPESKLDDLAFYKYYELNNQNRKNIIAFPDGCIDIQCGIIGDKITVTMVGSSLEGGTALTSIYDKCFGVRLRPGIIPRELCGKMDLIVANRLDITDRFEKSLLEKLIKDSTSSEERIEFFRNYFTSQELMIEKNEIAEYVIDFLSQQDGNVNISEIIDNLGYSHRYSDRVFKNNVGVSIKKYAGIIRLQKAVCSLISCEKNIYDELGYYDQSHFIHDFKKFTSYTPSNFTKITEKMQIV